MHQGRLDEAEPWLERAERILRTEVEPAAGMSLRDARALLEIADELFVSENTVSTHRRHLYAKLGVHSRHEAVDRARALGLLAPSRLAHGKVSGHHLISVIEPARAAGT